MIILIVLALLGKLLSLPIRLGIGIVDGVDSVLREWGQEVVAIWDSRRHLR